MNKKIVSFIHNMPTKITLPEDIGLDSVPDKIRRRSIIEGFHINILIIGRRGLGTTTLMNALFISSLVDKERPNSLSTFKNEVYENDICLKTSITTYHNNDINEVLQFLETRNSEYFESEQGLTRPRLDTRIHLTLYLLPTDTVTSDEISMMKKVSEKCNLVPLISKADSFTRDELANYKQKINDLINENEINIFKPEIYKGDDRELDEETTAILNRYPLAIYASTESHEFNGESRLGRLYPWGFLDIENDETNDFISLRKLIVSNHLDDFINFTDIVFYNEYRKVHMESERVDELLKTRRIERIKAEMEKIYEERSKINLDKKDPTPNALNLEVNMENDTLGEKVKNINLEESEK